MIFFYLILNRILIFVLNYLFFNILFLLDIKKLKNQTPNIRLEHPSFSF